MIQGVLIGMVLGAGLILPGVSGGVLAVILGVYEKILYSLNNFFKSKKENLMFLLPIIIGMIIGLLVFGKILKFLFNEYYIQSCFAFMGLILGGVPILFRRANSKGKVNKPILIIAFVFSLVLFMLGKNKVDFSTSLNGDFTSLLKLFLTGFIFTTGKVIPGISSSFMLMLIGMYDYFLNILSNPTELFLSNFFGFCSLIVGIIAGLVVFVKLINLLLEKWYSITYSIIIGFVVGSLPAIYPGFEFNSVGILSVVIFISAFVGSYKISLLSKGD